MKKSAYISIFFILMTFKSGVVFSEENINNRLQGPLPGMEFVYIPPGSYHAGNDSYETDYHTNFYDNYENDEKINITKGFYLQKTEVTQGQWKAVMRNNPSYFRNCGDNCPVENISWFQIQNFITRLNAKKNGVFRLPTSAEWGYACRSGNDRLQYDHIEKIAWYDENSGQQTHPAMLKRPNLWGLYDMLGNVWEWCSDHYGHYLLTESDEHGSLVIDGYYSNTRILRGGGWFNHSRKCSADVITNINPYSRSAADGFRLVRER